MAPRSIEATVDHVAISRLQTAYADIVDRRAWAELHGIFTPDITLDLDLVDRPGLHVEGPDAIGRFIGEAIERFEFFEFVVLNSHIELWPGGDRTAAAARVFMAEIRRPAGQVERDDAYGLYRDRYVLVDDEWRIAARRYRSLGRFPSGDVFPLTEADAAL